MKLNQIPLIVFLLTLGIGTSAHGSNKNYTMKAEAGLGYDSNAYLSPDSSYYDPFAMIVRPPNTQSGMFVPFSIKGDSSRALDKHNMISKYSLSGQKYFSSSLSNADNYKASLDLGLEKPLMNKGKKKDRFYIGGLMAYKKDIYVDRDTGLEAIGDRYVYFSYGLEANLKKHTGKIQYALTGKYKKYDYEEIPSRDSLDYTYLLLGGDLGFDISQASKLKLSYDIYTRDYENYSARDLTGATVPGTARKYTYNKLGVSLRNKLSSTWTAYLDYNRLTRDDEYVGYNDYTRNKYGIRALYRDKQDRKLNIRLAYWEREYPNAYIFDNQAFANNTHKSYKTINGKLQAEQPFKGPWRLWAEYELTLQDTSDPRYDYNRHQIMAGIKTTL